MYEKEWAKQKTESRGKVDKKQKNHMAQCELKKREKTVNKRKNVCICWKWKKKNTNLNRIHSIDVAFWHFLWVATTSTTRNETMAVALARATRNLVKIIADGITKSLLHTHSLHRLQWGPHKLTTFSLSSDELKHPKEKKCPNEKKFHFFFKCERRSVDK